ncbi:MAG TPA: glycosyltransferase, partial [Chloroflexota bacterium]|nr:glycosyltransferase [Chloroflexota bacterium]
MRLSLAIVTRNSSQYIETLLKVGRGLADEVVVAVDASSSDATEEICEKYADKLFKFAPIPNPERPLGWLNRQCSGDWILRLDDDELPSAGLVRKLPELLRDRDMTHYWLRRRWVVGRNSQSWIHQRPWWPDWQLRLFRNIPSIVHVPGTLHTSYLVQGAYRYLTGASLYHFDLVYHSREERLQKIARYRQVAGDASGAEFYLTPEELPPAVGSVSLPPFPLDDLPARAPSAWELTRSRWDRPFARLLGRKRSAKGGEPELATSEDLLLS